MKLKKLLAGVLSAAMVLCTVSLPAFADGEDVVKIGTVDEFVQFAKDVNGGDSFKGKTVMLTNDMDLSDKDWTPIGKSGKPFSGTFDGDGHTISNLKTGRSWLSDIGLFGLTTDAAVKNFTVENAEVTGYLDVGVVAGTPYTSKYSNITVKGDIKVNGYAYVGGALGKNAYADVTKVNVLSNPGSYVKAYSDNYRTYIGGLIGFMGEGNVTVSDCDVAIDVIGSTCDIGGILGILHYGNTLQNCTYEGSITLDNDLANLDKGDETEFGALVGVAMNSKSGATKMTNCTANIISAIRCGTDITDSITSYGNNYYRTSPAEKHLYITTVNGVKTLDAKDYTEKEIDSFIKGSYYIDGKIIKTPEEIKNNDNLTDSEKADIVVRDGDVLPFADGKIEVMHTPGHTEGSVCYLIEDKIFSGDTLFYGSVGRTDFKTGSYDDIIKSVKRLASLDGDRKVYPGHNMLTTLDNERKHNVYLKDAK